MPRRFAGSLCLLAGLALPACSGGSGAFGHRNPDPGPAFNVPSQVSGGTRGGGRPEEPNAARQADEDKQTAEEKAAKAEKVKAEGLQEAEDLWNQAQATGSPSKAASKYRKIAEDHKDSPRAEDARWLESQKSYEAGDWTDAVTALMEYVKAYPINPHLPEAERMLYQASVNVIEGSRGLKGIFRSDKKGYEGLETIVERFPQGSYPDDALLMLGDTHRRKDDLAEACLAYRNLLLRYPDSEWSFEARLRLADAYLARDQGADYHAGYVDLDPRGPTTPQYAAGRPVRSCVEAAQENYQAYVDRMTADPARRAEYATTIAYAEGRIEECRRRVADKDRSIAAYYARAGRPESSEVYGRFAENAIEGRPWCEAVPGAPPRSSAPAAPGNAPPTAPPVPPAAPPSESGTPVAPPPPPPLPPAPPPAPRAAPPVAPATPPPGPTQAPPIPEARPPSAPPAATAPSTVPPAALPPPRHLPSKATVVR